MAGGWSGLSSIRRNSRQFRQRLSMPWMRSVSARGDPTGDAAETPSADMMTRFAIQGYVRTIRGTALQLKPEFLKVMKQLGDGAIHPNDGDIAKQLKLDNQLLAKLAHTFQMLLFLIYELPHEKQKRLDGLKAGIVKK